MKISDKTRWLVSGGLAVSLILVALFQIVTGITFNVQFMKYFELVVLLGVLYLIVIYPRQQQSKQNQEKAEEELAATLEEEEFEKELED